MAVDSGLSQQSLVVNLAATRQKRLRLTETQSRICLVLRSEERTVAFPQTEFLGKIDLGTMARGTLDAAARREGVFDQSRRPAGYQRVAHRVIDAIDAVFEQQQRIEGRVLLDDSFQHDTGP